MSDFTIDLAWPDLSPTDLKVREEVFVSALEDVELGVVELGVVVEGAVSLPDEAAHSRAALRRELAVEDDDHAFLRAGRDDGGVEEEGLHLLLLVQVQSSLRPQSNMLAQRLADDSLQK